MSLWKEEDRRGKELVCLSTISNKTSLIWRDLKIEATED